MNEMEIYQRLTGVFCDVFDDDGIQLSPETTANDVDDWDSFQHINLIHAVEREFKMKFSMRQVSSMKNVGEMVNIIANSG
jgi:acyl carrier protein